MNGYSKKFRILAALDLALAAAIVLGLVFSPRASDSRSARRDLLADASAVQSIRISGAESVELIRNGSGWSMVSPDGRLPADGQRIDAFLKAVDSVERAEEVARDESSRSRLGLAGDSARKVTLLDADGAVLSGFALGGYAQAPGSVYVSIGGSPASYAVASGMASYILGKRGSWLDLDAWTAPPAVEAVQELIVRGSIEGTDGRLIELDYTAARSGDGWNAGGVVLDASRVAAAIRAIAVLRGDDYAPAAEAAGPVALSIELRLGNGRSMGLSVERKRSDGRYPAASSQRDRRLYLPSWALTEAVKPLDSLAVTVRPGRP